MDHRGYCRYVVHFAVGLAAALMLVVPIGATEYEVSDDTAPPELIEGEELPPDEELPSGGSVYIVSDVDELMGFISEASQSDEYQVYEVTSDVQLYAAGDTDAPFYGSAWAEGTVPGLGTCRLYFPINRKELVGLDSSGRLFNVSDNSWSGVMYDSSGDAYTVSFGSFALPRYRVPSGSSWDYETLYFTPSESNLVLPDSLSPTYSLYDLLPWVGLLLLGGVFLCSMRKS